MRDISEKTGVSIGVLLTLIGLLAGGFSTAVVSVYKTDANARQQEEMKVAMKELALRLETAAKANEVAINSLALAYGQRLTVVESAVTNINSSLGRIEGLLNRQANQANYVPNQRARGQ